MSSTVQVADESPAYDDRRIAELQAGRARLQELHEAARKAGVKDSDEKDLKRRFRDADEEIKEDERRRHELLNFAPINRVDRDRAGAEVADQAQTQLEAVLHNADRQETIIASAHQIAVEELDHPTVDTKRAEALTTDMVTAQAVNQPVVLANEAGVDTESKPMNPHDFDEGLIDPRLVTMPEEKFTPRTRKKAEKVSRHKIPRTEEVVVDGWHDGVGPNPDAAVKEVVRINDPEALG
jgi:hypothetical protein